MKVTRIRIRNYMAFRDFEIRPAPTGVTWIRGSNGTGKTSAAEAVISALCGGKDPTVLRAGMGEDDKTEVMIELDGGQSTIIRRWDSDGKPTLSKQKGAIGSQSEIERLIDVKGVSPAEILNATAARQLDIVLESLPLSVRSDQLAECVSGCNLDQYTIEEAAAEHALVAIDQLSRRIYNARTGINRSAEDKRRTVSELESTLPEIEEKDWEAELLRLDAVKTNVQREHQEKHREIDGLLAAEKLETEQESNLTIGKAREAAQAEISRIMSALQVHIKSLDEAKTERIADADRKMVAARKRIDEAWLPKISQASADLGTGRANAERCRDAQKTRSRVQTMTQEALALEAQAELHTGGRDNLERLKTDLVKRLPVPDLEVREGKLFLKGVPFHRANTAAKVRAIMKICELRAGALGLIVFDGIESFDAETVAAFEKEAEDSGLQWITTCVERRYDDSGNPVFIPLTVDAGGQSAGRCL